MRQALPAILRTLALGTSLAVTLADARPATPASGSPVGSAVAAGPQGDPDTDANKSAWISVELAWIADPAVCPFYPSAAVRGQTLEVSGYVPDTRVRDRVIKLALQHCSLDVLDNLKVFPRAAMPPARVPGAVLLQAAITALRAELPAGQNQVQVLCSNEQRLGVIGTVCSEERKLLVSQCLRRLKGCTAVVNLLQVCPPEHEAAPAPHPATVPAAVQGAAAAASEAVAREPRAHVLEIAQPTGAGLAFAGTTPEDTKASCPPGDTTPSPAAPCTVPLAETDPPSQDVVVTFTAVIPPKGSRQTTAAPAPGSGSVRESIRDVSPVQDSNARKHAEKERAHAEPGTTLLPELSVRGAASARQVLVPCPPASKVECEGLAIPGAGRQAGVSEGVAAPSAVLLSLPPENDRQHLVQPTAQKTQKWIPMAAFPATLGVSIVALVALLIAPAWRRRLRRRVGVNHHPHDITSGSAAVAAHRQTRVRGPAAPGDVADRAGGAPVHLRLQPRTGNNQLPRVEDLLAEADIDDFGNLVAECLAKAIRQRVNLRERLGQPPRNLDVLAAPTPPEFHVVVSWGPEGGAGRDPVAGKANGAKLPPTPAHEIACDDSLSSHLTRVHEAAGKGTDGVGRNPVGALPFMAVGERVRGSTPAEEDGQGGGAQAFFY